MRKLRSSTRGATELHLLDAHPTAYKRDAPSACNFAKITCLLFAFQNSNFTHPSFFKVHCTGFFYYESMNSGYSPRSCSNIYIGILLDIAPEIVKKEKFTLLLNRYFESFCSNLFPSPTPVTLYCFTLGKIIVRLFTNQIAVLLSCL